MTVTAVAAPEPRDWQEVLPIWVTIHLDRRKPGWRRVYEDAGEVVPGMWWVNTTDNPWTGMMFLKD